METAVTSPWEAAGSTPDTIQAFSHTEPGDACMDLPKGMAQAHWMNLQWYPDDTFPVFQRLG